MNIRRIMFGIATAVAVVMTGACSSDAVQETPAVNEQPGHGGNAPMEVVESEDTQEAPKSPKNESVYIELRPGAYGDSISKRCDGTTLVYIYSNGRLDAGGLAVIPDSPECE